MEAQNGSRESTDAHRYLWKLWWLDAEMLSVVPWGEACWGVGALSLLGVCAASVMAAAK